MFVQLEYAAAAAGLFVGPDAFEDPQSVVQAVAQDVNLRVRKGDELAVHPDVCTLNAHLASIGFPSESR